MTNPMPGPVLIKGVRLYGEGDQVDVLVADGQIAQIGPALTAGDDTEVIDAAGQVLLPGLVDLHTHLREPGREYAETIETGSAAAALGGYTAVFAMANTDPVADSTVVTDHVWQRGQQVGLCDVHPVGAVTVGLEGRQLTEMGLMAAGLAQVRLFSDDGLCVHDPLVMRRALEYAAGLGVLIAQHPDSRWTLWPTKGLPPPVWDSRAGHGRQRNRSSHAMRCWPATPVRASTSATLRPGAR